VGRGAVQLDGQPLFGPEGVNAHATDLGIDVWERKASVLAELEETFLENAQGSSQLWQVAPKGDPHCLGASAPALERRLHLTDDQQPTVVGFGEGASKLARRQQRAKVDKGSGHRGDTETLAMKGDDLAGVVDTNIRQ
jgi:hypothetical protein